MLQIELPRVFFYIDFETMEPVAIALRSITLAACQTVEGVESEAAKHIFRGGKTSPGHVSWMTGAVFIVLWGAFGKQAIGRCETGSFLVRLLQIDGKRYVFFCSGCECCRDTDGDSPIVT